MIPVHVRNRWARRFRILAWIFATYLVLAGLFFGLDPLAATVNLPVVFREGLAPLLFQLVFAMVFLVVQFGGLMWFMSRGRTYTLMPGEYDVTFDDVRGQDAAVNATREVLRLFQGHKQFRESGGLPPHGLLFEGPPGTGKTLLAKAVAGEAAVPFIYAPGTGFTNMFFGVGNLRVSFLFRKARRLAHDYGGCVIFLDELDAVGGSRGGVQDSFSPAASPIAKAARYIVPGAGGGMGGMLVNELLLQMDGLVTPRGILLRPLRRFLRRLGRTPRVPSYNLLVIGATNRAASLDPALLRPGRFDRKVHVGNPAQEGRRDIAEYYLAKVKHDPTIDTRRLAASTVGYSPAQIKNIVNEALILALQDGRDSLNWNDLWRAKLTEELGLREAVTYTDAEKRAVAYHEAGHAVVAFHLKPEFKVQIVSVIKRESALGLVHGMPVEETFSKTLNELMSEIIVSLGGLAAERIFLGYTTSGPSSDLRRATDTAARMVGLYGMTHKPWSPVKGRTPLISTQVLATPTDPNGLHALLGHAPSRDQVQEYLGRAHAAALRTLTAHADQVHRIADALIERGELYGDEFEALMLTTPTLPTDGDGSVHDIEKETEQ